MQRSKFLNKVDFARDLSVIPDTDKGNLRLYYELALIRDSFTAKYNNAVEGFPESPDQHVSRYLELVELMGKRGLTVPRDKNTWIERAINKLNVRSINYTASLHCPTCGAKLSENEIAILKCDNCHGVLPSNNSFTWIQKPFGPFKDWDACMSHMTTSKEQGGGGYDTETAKKVCGKMQAQGEKKSVSSSLKIEGTTKGLDSLDDKLNSALEVVEQGLDLELKKKKLQLIDKWLRANG